MTNKQKIELRLSEVRSRLNEISGCEGANFTDEIRTEADKLKTEFSDLETRHQAAILAEPDPDQRGPEDNGWPDAEEREIRHLHSKVSLASYLIAAIEKRAVSGAEAEFCSAHGVGLDQVPLDALIGPEEIRQQEERAVTGAPSTTVISKPRPTIPPVFNDTIAARLGVRIVQVGSGVSAFPVIATAPASAAAFAAKSTAADAAAGSVTVATRSPVRLPARVTITEEDRAVLPSIENDFRMALRDRIMDVFDAQVLAGNGTSPNLTGLLQAATSVTADSTVISKTAWLAALTGLVDGTHANSLQDVVMVIGSETYSKLASVYFTYPDSDSLIDHTMRKVQRLIVSDQLPAKASNAQRALVVKTAKRERRPIEVPVWKNLSFVVDPYTRSAEGEIHITAFLLAASPHIPFATSTVVQLHPKISS